MRPKNRIRIKKLHGKFRNRGIAQRKNARSSWNVQKMGARRVGRVALTPSRAPPPLAGATPLTPPGAHQAARVQAGRASARCEVEGARGIPRFRTPPFEGAGVDPDAGLRPRRRRTPGIPSPGCGRASAAVPRPPGMRRASVAETRLD